MAASYWTSTQRQNWLFDSTQVADLREEVNKTHSKVIEQYPYPDSRLVFIFIKDRLIQLGKRLQFRQQCVATALIYLQRYFLFNAFQNVNMYLLVATAFYLASKTEESPHHIRLVNAEARQLWPEYMQSDVARLGEMEFCLISEMHSQLIVWHPYRSLISLKENQNLALTNEELSLAWSIINDTFMTDLPLTCPPYLIAITAVFLAVMFVPGKSGVDFKNLQYDGQSSSDNDQFSGIGGRPGVNTVFGHVVDGSAKAQQPGSAKQNDQASIKTKTLAAAANSEKMRKVTQFLLDSEIDIEQMIDATQEIISLYEIWEQYNEKAVKESITRCMRAQNLEG